MIRINCAAFNAIPVAKITDTEWDDICEMISTNLEALINERGFELNEEPYIEKTIEGNTAILEATIGLTTVSYSIYFSTSINYVPIADGDFDVSSIVKRLMEQFLYETRDYDLIKKVEAYIEARIVKQLNKNDVDITIDEVEVKTYPDSIECYVFSIKEVDTNTYVSEEYKGSIYNEDTIVKIGDAFVRYVLDGLTSGKFYVID